MKTMNFKIFEEFRSHTNPRMMEEIRLFLGVEDGVSECRVEEDDSQKIYVNILLEKFSYLLARNIFLHLAEFMKRSYFNVYVCEEMEERVRYHFLTGLSGKDGVKMEVVFG